MKKIIALAFIGITVAAFLFSAGVQDETTIEAKEPTTLHWLLWLAVPEVWPDKLIEDLRQIMHKYVFTSFTTDDMIEEMFQFLRRSYKYYNKGGNFKELKDYIDKELKV